MTDLVPNPLPPAPIWSNVDKPSLIFVVTGGFFGGLLHPIAAEMGIVPTPAPTEFFLFSPLMGIAAAGISVFVLANSKLDDKLRLIFFAVMCGLAFPTVLAEALDPKKEKSEEVAGTATDVIDSVKSSGANEKSVTTTANTLRENPPSTLEDDAVEELETAAEDVIDNVVSQAQGSNDSSVMQGQLLEIGLAAQRGGYDAIVKESAAALIELDAPEKAGQVLRDENSIHSATPQVE